MRLSKIERRIFEAAEKLTPEPPSFDAIDAKVNWEEVASKARPSHKMPRLVPFAIAGSICLAAGLVVGLVVPHVTKPSEKHGSYDITPVSSSVPSAPASASSVIFGHFDLIHCECGDGSLDLTGTCLTVEEGKRPSADNNAWFFDQNGNVCCTVTFSNELFSEFSFNDFIGNGKDFRGEASYSSKPCIIDLYFPSNNGGSKIIELFIHGSALSSSASAQYQLVE